MAKRQFNRREFLRAMGLGGAMVALNPMGALAQDNKPTAPATAGKMTYRVQNGSGERISLLGFGMMRLPRDNQELVNQLVDYALAHGVNYFDTAPIYGRGLNEGITGAALSRHPRESYYIATKMSNYNQATWPLEESKKMYYNSFKQLRTDYIDYYLLHGIGQSGMKDFNPRFIDNGLLDFLVEERKAGRIRHLGFSYHGNVEVFDWLINHHDKYHWDFVQIQMNFLDWRHASLSGEKDADADAEYLYNQLAKHDIQAVIMEPYRGGALGKMSEGHADQLKELRPDDTIARWAFRWVGSKPGVLTVLSGMNVMEHLVENCQTYSPLEQCTEAENDLLEKIADSISGIPVIPCTTCAYCMPCPYGVDIPGNFTVYNDAMHSGLLPLPTKKAPDYDKRHEAFVKAYFDGVPADKRATQCIDCGHCLPLCPQQIRIPSQMGRITQILRKR
ncbi:MAG: aldo/keto reductase [Muribaculaceae bacterium]|nr:aldo/keto reductase [Muribaculaceae bacterium]